MTLTPLDIKRQQFARTFRGYAPAEVDAFVKQVSDRVESADDKLRAAEDRVRELEVRLVHYERVEMALQEALQTARETAARTEAAAEARARAVLESAETRAGQITSDAERERFEIRRDIRQLSTRQAEVAARLRGFLLSELEVLAHFQGDDPVGFLQLRSSRGDLVGARTEHAADLRESSAPEDPLPGDEPRAEPERDGVPEAAPPEPLTHDDTPDPREDRPSGDATAEPLEDAMPAARERGDEARAALADPEPPRPPRPGPPTWAEAPLGPSSAAPSEGVSDPSLATYGWRESPARPSEELPGETGEQPSADAEHVAPEPPRAAPPAWNLRSLVTDDDGPSVAASDTERDRIRRLLDDLD